jgi:hypothetical protein
MDMAQTTLAECASSLSEYERRERVLGEGICKYRDLMRRREGVMRRLDAELRSMSSSSSFRSTSRMPPTPSGNAVVGEIRDDDDDDDIDDDDPEEGAKSHDDVIDHRHDAGVRRLSALRARHEIDANCLRDVVALHVDILAEVETLRRGMGTLIASRDGVAMKLEENAELFVVAAAAGHDHDEEGVTGNGDPP